MSWTRRRFLAAAGAGVVATGAGVVYVKGVRYPPVQFEPATRPVTAHAASGSMITAQGAYAQAVDGDLVRLRAFAMEPEITVTPGAFELRVENIHPESEMSIAGPAQGISESRHGLTRILTGTSSGVTRLQWRFPRPERFRFAAIGDTGGGRELAWAIQRAHALGAEFLIHLGDFNYVDGDFERSVRNLNAASIPTFAAIGNHDFHDGWRSVHGYFTRYIGPRNSVFRLGRVRFVNLDTAADSIPPYRGERARLLADLAPARPDSPLVVFTHRPFSKIKGQDDWPQDHNVRGPGEAAWIRRQLVDHGVTELLAGHVHINAELLDSGIKTYITGQGLAHADLIVGHQTARILLGEADGTSVSYRWAPLAMPVSYHCNPRAWRVFEVHENPALLRQLETLCGRAQPG